METIKLNITIDKDWLEATWTKEVTTINEVEKEVEVDGELVKEIVQEESVITEQLHCESFSGHPEHIAMLEAKALEFGTSLDEYAELIEQVKEAFIMPTDEELLAQAVEVKNAVVVDLKDKGQIMGIKVPNKDKKGYHIEYAILGKDKFGRSAYERLTQKSDAVARLKSQNLDPNLFESLVMKQNEAEYTAKDKKDSIRTIKYYNASTSSDSQSDEEDPNMK